MTYVYYCERCGAMFEVPVPSAEEAPAAFECPKCEYPHAVKAFAAPQGGGCACGPSSGGAGKG